MLPLLRTAGLAALLPVLFPPAPAPPDDASRLRRDTLQHPELAATERLPEMQRYDFAPLWLGTDNAQVYGFIGPDCQRLQLKLLTARRDAQNPRRYLVTGKSRVRGTVCAFSGTFTLSQARAWQKVPPGLDGEPTPARQAGVVLLDYELREMPGQPHAGTFRGVACTRWFLDQQGRLRYDNLRSFADNYANNQFAGTWTSYQTRQTKRCHWGDYRIPYAGPLDIGAGEFSPADAYLARGWQGYQEAMGTEAGSAARQAEERQWW